MTMFRWYCLLQETGDLLLIVYPTTYSVTDDYCIGLHIVNYTNALITLQAGKLGENADSPVKPSYTPLTTEESGRTQE